MTQNRVAGDVNTRDSLPLDARGSVFLPENVLQTTSNCLALGESEVPRDPMAQRLDNMPRGARVRGKVEILSAKLPRPVTRF